MEDLIAITQLNDFIFCPASIYFHQLYGSQERLTFQCSSQIAGTQVHKSIDKQKYTSSKNILQGVSVLSSIYGVQGKIDLFYIDLGLLRERKRQIKVIYDGYVFQIYAQYWALSEMGYTVKAMELYSYIDNKSYPILLPTENLDMQLKFEQLIYDLRHFSLENFFQSNREKCAKCIYEPACDRTLID